MGQCAIVPEIDESDDNLSKLKVEKDYVRDGEDKVTKIDGITVYYPDKDVDGNTIKCEFSDIESDDEDDDLMDIDTKRSINDILADSDDSSEHDISKWEVMSPIEGIKVYLPTDNIQPEKKISIDSVHSTDSSNVLSINE